MRIMYEITGADTLDGTDARFIGYCSDRDLAEQIAVVPGFKRKIITEIQVWESEDDLPSDILAGIREHKVHEFKIFLDNLPLEERSSVLKKLALSDNESG